MKPQYPMMIQRVAYVSVALNVRASIPLIESPYVVVFLLT